jgi:hypothetical protein
LQFGWLFPICWFMGMLLPFFSKNIHDRRAAVASGIMLAIMVVIIVFVVAMGVTIFKNTS